MPHVRILSSVLILALVGTSLMPATLPGQGCVAREGGSRWVADHYEATHRYGSGGQDWLATFGGIGVTEERVYVFDQGRPAVLRLTPTLSLEDEFSRRGAGPGEVDRPYYITWVPGYLDFDFLGVDDTSVVIFDQIDFEGFNTEGDFLHQTRIGGWFQPAGFGIRYVDLNGEGEILYVNDSIDVEGPRRLQVWRLDPAEDARPRELMWEVPLPWEGGEEGLHVLAREARPFWARHAGCQVASDGAGDFLWRYDESFERLDSLALPPWTVPQFGKDPEDRRRINIGGRTMGTADPEPVALIRWTDLALDPDGFVWLRAWTSKEEQEGLAATYPVEAFVGSVETGRFTHVNLPSFPRAFGEAGVFYALEADPETDEQSLIRYERR